MVAPASFDVAVTEVAALLKGAGIVHALIGGIAGGLHGYPRATADVDLLVDGDAREEAIAWMTAAGYALVAAAAEVLRFQGRCRSNCCPLANIRTRKCHDQADIAELIRANSELDWNHSLRCAEMFDAAPLLEKMRQGVRD